MAIHPLVLVDGPPRCGKSTLARQLAASSSAGAILARAGSPDGRRLLSDPLALSAARPVILDGATMDEAQFLASRLSAQPSTRTSAGPPALPAAQPARLPRFVLVGGPFGQKASQAGSTMPRLTLGPLSLAEVGRGGVRTHWLRGGYPEAYAAVTDSTALANLENLIAGMSGGQLSAWGLPASPTRLSALLTYLAQAPGGRINENALARLLDTSRPTICRWMESLEQAGILRRVPRLSGEGGARRTVQAPGWLVRDSGLIHGLLGIGSATDLRAMPRLAAASWQAYVLEQTAGVIDPGTELGSYLSADGACIELVLSSAEKVIAATTRVNLPVSPGRSTSLGAEAVGATDRYIVVPEGMPRNIGGGFRAIGLAAFLDEACSVSG